MLATLGPLTPNLAIGNGLEAGVDLARPGGRRRVPRRSARPRPDRAAPGPLPRRRRRVVRALAPRWHGADAAALRRQRPLRASRRQRRLRGGGAGGGRDGARPFASLFHEIFNEPEQDEVLGVRPTWLDTLNLSPDEEPDDERTRSAATDPERRGRSARPLRRARLGRRDRPADHQVHRSARQEPDVRRRVAASTASSTASSATPRRGSSASRCRGSSSRWSASRAARR